MMKSVFEVADRLFPALLILEFGILGICFLDCGLAEPGSLPSIGRDHWNTLPVWISSLQLAAIGALFLASIRRSGEAEGPSGIFFLLSGLLFLLLAWKRTIGPVLAPADILRWLPAVGILFLLIWRAGRRSFLALWTRFHQESLIILAGVWLYLFGAAGVEILQLQFFRNGSPLEAGWPAFFEMSGGTVILYGLVLFRRERDRGDSLLAAA